MIQALAIAGLSFVLYALTSLAWAPATNWTAVANLLGMAGAYLAGLWITDHSRVWTGFILLSAAFGGAYLIAPVINPNYAGCLFALALAVSLVEAPLWALAFGPLLAYTQSRGAILAGAAAIAIQYGRRFPTFAVTIIAFGVILVVSQKSLGGSLIQRLGIWQDTLSDLTLFGHGWGSFEAWYTSLPVKTNMTLLIAPHAYNDYLELLAQLGIGAGFAIALIIFCLFAEGSKLVPITFLLCGLTYFPLSIPILAQAFAFSLGQLARTYHEVPTTRICRA